MYEWEAREIDGYYGGSKTPCTVFVLGNAYCVEDSCNVNFTSEVELLVDGVDVEELHDYDCSQAKEPFGTLEEFEEYVNE